MNLTTEAENQIKKLLTENDDAIAIRIGIIGGGCSGFSYAFTFADMIEDGDVVVNDHDAIVIVDPLSYQYLQDAEIDYVKNIEGERFVINNPIVSNQCGCGMSFSI